MEASRFYTETLNRQALLRCYNSLDHKFYTRLYGHGRAGGGFSSSYRASRLAGLPCASENHVVVKVVASLSGPKLYVTASDRHSAAAECVYSSSVLTAASLLHSTSGSDSA